MTDFFDGIAPIAFEGQDSRNDLAFRHYDPDEMLGGKSLRDHLRFSIAWWHSFAWPGGDPFGGQTFDRPWFGDTMALAKLRPMWRSKCSRSWASPITASTMRTSAPKEPISPKPPATSKT